MSSQIDKQAIVNAIAALRREQMPRRRFVKAVTAAGLSMAAANALAVAWSGTARAQSTAQAPVPDKSYDYIIVGAGSGGAALAGRLAQLTDASVLVLEAGGMGDLEDTAYIRDPADWPIALSKPITRHYSTVPQVHTQNRVVDWPRAYGIGGCSDINAMIYCRGYHTDYDTWAYEGNVGWDFQSVLAAYKELEDWEGGASEWRGAGGPLHVTQPAPDKRHPGAQAFIDGAKSLGFPENLDFNTGLEMVGASWVNFTIYGGTRQSTGLAFLKPAMSRSNLTVLTDAPTLRVVVDNGRATGVTYLHNGLPVTVKAHKEIVLCAGTLESPKILMHSGIGNAAELQKLGIKPVVNLPGVGQNLHDHILGAGCNWEAKGPVPPSNYNDSEVYMWWRSEARLAAPDVNVLYVSLPFSTPQLPLPKVNGYSILSGVQRPQSRGSLKLASADPSQAPVINPNYLAVEEDWKAFEYATNLAREIGNSSAYASFRKRELLPGPAVKTKAEMKDFLAKSCWTFFHPVGTCKMGVDEMAVVDPQLKVHGVEGLRVADASVMPSITSGNTNAPTIMIGWRAAGFLANVAQNDS